MDLDINEYLSVPGMINYQGQYCGTDSPGKSNGSLKDFREYPIQDFDYQFNSWGFRGPEYDQYIGEPVNICVGDSATVNLGGPVEHSWCGQLAEHFDIPTLNLGMSAAGNDAIKLVYDRASELFNIQNIFVMYSYLHRRTVDNKFIHHSNTSDIENFDYFLEQRIPNAIECALPGGYWSTEEEKFLSDEGIYFFDTKLYFADYQHIDRKYIVKEDYNNIKAPNWPTLKEFVNGADPHPDMFKKKFGQFISHQLHTNRDGSHMNYNTNKIYADYLHQQWKQNNES